MSHIVTERCIRCKYTDCVEVCPVDCFHEGPNFLVIDPDECIDCTLCIAECPVNAIFAEEDLPPDQRAFVALNAELSRRWPVLSAKKPPLEDADEWASVEGKLPHLDRGEPKVHDPDREASGAGATQDGPTESADVRRRA